MSNDKEPAAQQPSSVATSGAPCSPTVAGAVAAAPTCRTEFVASWHDYEGAVCVTLEDYERVERERDEAMADAESWSQQCSDRVRDWDEMRQRAEKAEVAYLQSGDTNKYEGGNLHDWWNRAIKAESALARYQRLQSEAGGTLGDANKRAEGAARAENAAMQSDILGKSMQL